MIYISCQFDTPLGRSDYSDNVRALQLDVSAYDDVGNRILLGQIVADQVLIGDAQSNGMPLFDVCDQDSQGLYETYGGNMAVPKGCWRARIAEGSQ